MERPDWDQYFIQLCEVIKCRSTCLRRHIGAILVKDNRILSTGYNGPPTNIKHCAERGGCIREKLKIPSGEHRERCYANHAEANCILQAAKFGISVEGATLYCTTSCCSDCMKDMISVGIKRIVISGDKYPDELADELIIESGIQIDYIKLV